MTTDISTRLEELSDHIFAVQLMLLSHISATAELTPETLDHTLELAKSQSEFALTSGRTRVAIRLDAMAESLRQIAMGAAND